MPLSAKLIVDTAVWRFNKLEAHFKKQVDDFHSNRASRLYEPIKEFTKNWCAGMMDAVPILLEVTTALQIFETKFNALGEDLCLSRDKLIECNEVQNVLEVNSNLRS